MERRLWMVLAGIAVVWAGWALAGGRWLTAAVVVVVVGGFAWWNSPWRDGRRSTTHRDALASGGRVVVYWRPGCPFCERLRRGLGSAGRDAVWVNIWRDDEAAAFVRSVNDGNEVVPTVVVDGEAHTNPDPALVRAALAR